MRNVDKSPRRVKTNKKTAHEEKTSTEQGPPTCRKEILEEADVLEGRNYGSAEALDEEQLHDRGKEAMIMPSPAKVAQSPNSSGLSLAARRQKLKRGPRRAEMVAAAKQAAAEARDRQAKENDLTAPGRVAEAGANSGRGAAEIRILGPVSEEAEAHGVRSNS